MLPKNFVQIVYRVAVDMDGQQRFVPNVHFELIPIKNLVSNQKYQRSLSQTQIDRASADFDLHQVNPVKVSRRDGINYVFNGQHTVEIVAKISGSRETPVWCMIYDDLEYQHEADIFANQMRYVRALSALEIFQANLEAGNNRQLTILALVESYGLKIGDGTGGNRIWAISTVENIYEKYGYQILNRVLRLCVGTWEGEANSLSGKMLAAVAKLAAAFGEELNEDIFAEKLGVVPVKQLMRNAKERGHGSSGLAAVLLEEYNGRKRNPAGRLAVSKLMAGV